MEDRRNTAQARRVARRRRAIAPNPSTPNPNMAKDAGSGQAIVYEPFLIVHEYFGLVVLVAATDSTLK